MYSLAVRFSASVLLVRTHKLDWNVKRVSRIRRRQRSSAGVVGRRCLAGVRDRVIKRLTQIRNDLT